MIKIGKMKNHEQQYDICFDGTSGIIFRLCVIVRVTETSFIYHFKRLKSIKYLFGIEDILENVDVLEYMYTIKLTPPPLKNILNSMLCFYGPSLTSETIDF